jgi:hypothetical protein
MDLPSPERRRFRRIRARPLRDPLGQSVLALLGALLCFGGGAGMLVAGRSTAAVIALILAAASVAVYAGLAARAFKRDKAVRYWEDRRELRLLLSRRDAHLELQRGMLKALGGFDRRGAGGASTARPALAELVDGAYRVLDATSRDDVAAILALEEGRECRVLHAATNGRSRWGSLRVGRQFPLDDSLEEALARLARHHRAFEAPAPAGRLHLALLSEAPFGRADEAFFADLQGYLPVIARLSRPRASGKPRVSLVR